MPKLAAPPRLRLELAIEPLPLKTPFRIAGHRFDAMPALTAILGDSHCYGRGEACGVYYLDDRPDTMHATLQAHRDLPHPRPGSRQSLVQQGIPEGALLRPALLRRL